MKDTYWCKCSSTHVHVYTKKDTVYMCIYKHCHFIIETERQVMIITSEGAGFSSWVCGHQSMMSGPPCPQSWMYRLLRWRVSEEQQSRGEPHPHGHASVHPRHWYRHHTSGCGNQGDGMMSPQIPGDKTAMRSPQLREHSMASRVPTFCLGETRANTVM